MFWLTLVATWVIPGANAPNGGRRPYLGWYLFLWGLFTFLMWIGTFGKNRALQFVFLSLWILFLLLAVRDWTGSETIGKIAGFEGIVCGLSAVYLAMAEIINEARGRTICRSARPRPEARIFFSAFPAAKKKIKRRLDFFGPSPLFLAAVTS